jgi:rare lipoprotein A (peptidoglycan hydrolase)
MFLGMRRQVLSRCKVWTLFSAAALISTSMMLGVSSSEAKTPGRTYCFNGICHRVLSIPEMVAIVGQDQMFQASYYDDCRRDRYNPCGLTSSGEAYRPNEADSAASPVYPDGTILLIRNPENGNAAVVRVNNAGPYWRQRKLDVSRATAEKLGFAERGVGNLEVRVMSAPSIVDATYKQNRRYPQVPGPIGTFASLDQAQGGMMVAMALDAMSSSVFAPIAGKMLTAVKMMTPALANVLRTDSTRVASVDSALPQGISSEMEKNLVAVDKAKVKPETKAQYALGTSRKRVVVAARTPRKLLARSVQAQKSYKRARWAVAAPRRQFSGARSPSSRSATRAFAAIGSSSTKSSYWTSRASRKAAAISRSGPRAMRLATRKLSSIVRSDAARTAGASGAIKPRLRT